MSERVSEFVRSSYYSRAASLFIRGHACLENKRINQDMLILAFTYFRLFKQFENPLCFLEEGKSMHRIHIIGDFHSARYLYLVYSKSVKMR